MSFQTGVSFEDGIVSIDKLQKICQNDDFMYNDIINKPYGIIAMAERITNFTNATGATGTYETVLDSIYVTPPTENRLVACHIYIPKLSTPGATAYGGSGIYIYRDAEQVHYFSTSQTNQTTYSSSYSTFFFDILKKKTQYTYRIKIDPPSTIGHVQLTARPGDVSSTEDPIQFWVEDWGQSAV